MSQNDKPYGGCCASIPKHNCNDFVSESWCNQSKHSTYTKCGLCGKITGYHYKSFWKRLKALFKFSGVSPIK